MRTFHQVQVGCRRAERSCRFSLSSNPFNLLCCQGILSYSTLRDPGDTIHPHSSSAARQGQARTLQLRHRRAAAYSDARRRLYRTTPQRAAARAPPCKSMEARDAIQDRLDIFFPLPAIAAPPSQRRHRTAHTDNGLGPAGSAEANSESAASVESESGPGCPDSITARELVAAWACDSSVATTRSVSFTTTHCLCVTAARSVSFTTAHCLCLATARRAEDRLGVKAADRSVEADSE